MSNQQDTEAYERSRQRQVQEHANAEAADLLRRGWEVWKHVVEVPLSAWWEVSPAMVPVILRARVNTEGIQGFGYKPDGTPTMFGIPIKSNVERRRHELVLVIEA